ncbi:MAG: RNA 2'-phosphotransferase, partial [bacterium]|nr:RNA 2'-phosphotransferase [bacterium]
RLGAPDASELLLRICGNCSDPGWWVKTPIPQPRDCGSDLYVDHNCSGDRDGCDIAVVNDVVAVAASLNICLSPVFPGSAEGVNASRALSRLLRHTGPHRRATRSGSPIAMDTGGWCRVSAVMRQLRLTEANLLALVLHSEKSRFQVAALIREGRPVRLWTIRATSGHSIEWLDRNRLSWDI